MMINYSGDFHADVAKVVELEKAGLDVIDRVRASVAADVAAVLLTRSLPVDIRHNSKIGREKLAAWAADQIKN